MCKLCGCKVPAPKTKRLEALMQRQPTIAEMVAQAVENGIPIPQPKRRRRGAAESIRHMTMLSARMCQNEDSDFDDDYISDSIWNKKYKHEEQEFDQHIFNVFTLDKIENQERKVHVTTAISVRANAGKEEEIEMWSRQVKPVLSKAPKRKQIKKRLRSTQNS